MTRRVKPARPIIATAPPELPSSNEHALYEKFWEAIHCSVRKQVEEFAKIQSQFKEGNIALLLCEAIDHDEFELCRKKSNLFKRNGIIRKEDKHRRPVEVGIKPTALVQFIRNQNGYQDFSSRKITDYLKDIGALTLQEEKSNTCHLGTDKKGRILPRVLRIDVQTLRDNAEKYDLFEQQAYE